jgi:hypothetical protein
MRIIHCLLDFTLGLPDFIAEKLNLHAKRRSLLEEARRSEILWYGCWYVDSFDPHPDEDRFIDPVERYEELIISMIKEHPEEAARLIRMLILEDPATYKEALLKEFKELMFANNLIKIGDIDKVRELLEKIYGSEKAKDILNRLTENHSTQSKPP